MANYVRNYVYCSKSAAEDICIKDVEKRLFNAICYDKNVFNLSDDDYFLLFETHGMNYYQEEIEKVIGKYRDIRWRCVEENNVEEGEFAYDYESDSVKLSVRPLVELCGNIYFHIAYYDLELRPLKLLFVTPGRITVEDILRNKRVIYDLSKGNDRLLYRFCVESQRMLKEWSTWAYNNEKDYIEEVHFTTPKYTDIQLEAAWYYQTEERESIAVKEHIKKTKDLFRRILSEEAIDLQIDYKSISDFI